MMSESLKQLRKEKGLTQVELAEKLNLSQSTIASWENGTRRPGLDFVPVLADFFGISVDDLLGRDTKKAPADAGDELRGRISRLTPANRDALSAYIDLLLISQASTAPAPGSPGSKP